MSWYGLRTWIEGGFKDFKRGLWGWHHSKMERASSVERLWLAMALAQLWCVSLGCQAEAEFEAACLQSEPAQRCLSGISLIDGAREQWGNVPLVA